MVVGYTWAGNFGFPQRVLGELARGKAMNAPAWGRIELDPGDFEFHFWEASTGAETLGSRIQGRWAFEQKHDGGWRPVTATQEMIGLGEELISQRAISNEAL